MEIDPVKVACYHRLIQLLEEHDPDGIQDASALFRVWYRIQTYCRNKPSYPNHGTWEEISSYLSYGTVSEEEEKGCTQKNT